MTVGRGVLLDSSRDSQGPLLFCLLASLNAVGDSNLGSFTNNLSRETCLFQNVCVTSSVHQIGPHLRLLDRALSGGHFPWSLELQPTFHPFLHQCSRRFLLSLLSLLPP